MHAQLLRLFVITLCDTLKDWPIWFPDLHTRSALLRSTVVSGLTDRFIQLSSVKVICKMVCIGIMSSHIMKDVRSQRSENLQYLSI